MTLEEKVAYLESENKEMLEKIDLLSFKLDLLFDNSESSRYIFERNFTHDQYVKIMDLMDEVRGKLDKKEKVSHSEFESKLRQIADDADYHDAEIITKLFMEEGRWEEVFPALYGNMPKYRGLF